MNPSATPNTRMIVNGCWGKTKFQRQAQAERSIKRIRKRDPSPRHDTLNAYPCKICGYFHIGHGYGARKTGAVRTRIEQGGTMNDQTMEGSPEIQSSGLTHADLQDYGELRALVEKHGAARIQGWLNGIVRAQALNGEDSHGHS